MPARARRYGSSYLNFLSVVAIFMMDCPSSAKDTPRERPFYAKLSTLKLNVLMADAVSLGKKALYLERISLH